MKIIISESQLDSLPFWKVKKGKLNRKYSFEEFNLLTKFLDLVMKEQKKQNHHADILIKPNSIEINLIDHEKGKVSEKCHRLANAFEKIYTKLS